MLRWVFAISSRHYHNFFISFVDKIVMMHFRERSTIAIGCDLFRKGGKGMRHPG